MLSQDVVGESCPSHFDSKSSSAINFSMHAELPRLPVLGTTSVSVDFRCSSGTRSWLQRSHIQRDVTGPARRATSDWKNRNLQPQKTRPSASAMVLARKHTRNEQRKLLNGKKQCTDSDGSDNNAGDGERYSLDMEEQLTSFVEYNATDMDSLDINPSQDFDGDEEQDTATQASQHMQSNSWKEVTDLNQFQDEASEIFDNVIYAPRSASITSADSKSSQEKRRKGREITRPFLVKKATITLEEKVVHDPLSDESEGSLSDGFDIAINLASSVEPAVQPSTISMNGSVTSPNVASNAQWRQRRSIKRDCSLIENSSNYSVNGRLLLMAPPTPIIASELSSDRVIELKDGCFDSSDDAEAVSMRRNEVSSSVLSYLPEMTTTVSSSLTEVPSLPMDFQPRLARKRRKVGQLTLESFFRPKKH